MNDEEAVYLAGCCCLLREVCRGGRIAPDEFARLLRYLSERPREAMAELHCQAELMAEMGSLADRAPA